MNLRNNKNIIVFFLILCSSLVSIIAFAQIDEEFRSVQRAHEKDPHDLKAAVRYGKILSEKKDYKGFYTLALKNPDIAEAFRGDPQLRKEVFTQFKLALEDSEPRLEELKYLLGTFLIITRDQEWTDAEKNSLRMFGAGKRKNFEVTLNNQSSRLLLDAKDLEKMVPFLKNVGSIWITGEEVTSTQDRDIDTRFSLKQNSNEISISQRITTTVTTALPLDEGGVEQFAETQEMDDLSEKDYKRLELHTKAAEAAFVNHKSAVKDHKQSELILRKMLERENAKKTRKKKVDSEKLTDSDRKAASKPEKRKKAIRKLPSDVEKAAGLSEGSQSKGTDPASLERGNERTKESRTTRESKERDGKKRGRDTKK